jgi:TatD DNase family protein
MGFYLGLNGIIFKLDLSEVIKSAPLDKILLETDCPYLTPPLPAEALAKAGPMTGRNEPLFVKYVAEKVAKIKNISYEEIENITTQNAKKLFLI